MRKHIYIAVAGILSVASISLCQAVEPNLSNLSLENLSPYLEADMPVRAAPEFVPWNANWEDHATTCKVDVDFLGKTLSIKLGFIRGSYDTYTQTFKAEPVISLRTSEGTYPYLRAGQNAHYRTLNVDIDNLGQTVRILNANNPSEQAIVLYSDLLTQWNTYASKKCSKHLNKTYCLVPQILWDGHFEQSGWVLTENTPLYSTTALPQDYVELFHHQLNSVNNYKPIAYSLALRLTFVLSDPEQLVWQIRQMTAEEAGNVMVDESKNHNRLNLMR